MGPAALAEDACRLDAPHASGWRLAVSGGLLDTTLVFDGFDAGLVQWSVLATAARRLGPELSVQAGVGALVGGTISPPGGEIAFRPGLVATASATWLALDGRGPRPFVAATLGVALAAASTEDGAPYRALDLSLSASVGRSFGGWVAPYLAAKVFGGPVSWRRDGVAVTGTDAHHFQVAVGAAARLPFGADLLLEVVPLGARGATVAVGHPL